MESRAQFEEWWESFYEMKPLEPWSSLYDPENDYYADETIDGQYEAWKASRAEIVIELPNWHVSDGIAVYGREDINRSGKNKGVSNAGIHSARNE